MSVAAPAAVKIGYEVANALGRLNSDRPLLGARCVEDVPIAQAIRFMLQALDLYQQASGRTTDRIGRDIRAGRIELRLHGGRALVVTP